MTGGSALSKSAFFWRVILLFIFFLGEARTNYGSRFLAQVHCMNCRTDSKTHEPFQDLSLDIPDRLQRRTKDQEEVCSLTYSLTRFFKVEELADSELYFCDNCMGKQRSTKRFWIHRLPNVSIFLLTVSLMSSDTKRIVFLLLFLILSLFLFILCCIFKIYLEIWQV